MGTKKAMTKPYKILIVEDDPNTADMLRAYFAGRGYRGITAPFGPPA